MNQKIIKQIAGVDVAQNELVVSLGYLTQDVDTGIIAQKAFKNNQDGFLKFTQWLEKNVHAGIPVQVVMEATGVYHESFAYFLADRGFSLSIVLPNKISNYARTLDTKTVTDKTSAEAIMLFGLQRKLTLWKRPSPTYKRLRQLTRERDQIIGFRTMAKNRLHAEQAEAEPNKESVVRINKQIHLFDKQIQEVVASINAVVQMDAELKRRVKQSCTITGIGVLTATTVLAETNGFDLISNKKQLSSYAGLDVREKQSGTSVKGKSKISKRGNRYLRKCLHMPALTAIRNDQRQKAVFTRLVSRHGIKMKAAVAVQRKLLEMMYTLFKKDENYNKDYYKELESDIKTAP